MAQISINNKVLSNIESDNIAEILNCMIDDELSKDIENVDTAFVDECVNALLELEKESNHLAILVPLISSDKFLKRITNSNRSAFKNLNVFAKTAIIAAIIASSTFTANAMVQSVTGVDIISTIAKKIEQSIGSSVNNDADSFNEDYSDLFEKTTTRASEPASSQANNNDSKNITASAQNTDEEVSKQNITSNDNGYDENETTTVVTTKEPTTAAKPIITQKDEKNRTLVGIYADITNFKTDYIYGEKFSYDGLKLYANYDDDSHEALSLNDCYYTKIYTTNETANYTLAIIYKTCKLEIDITVRPDEDTRGSDICSNSNFDYLLTSKGAYITAYKGKAESLAMNYVDGNKVIAIGAGIFENNNVKEVSAEYVTKIFENAFKNCTSLIKCNTPNAVYIGASAFDGCEKLNNISYSDSITYLGTTAFRKTAVENAIIPSGIIKIPDYLYEDCTQLKQVDFKGRVTEIGKSSFAGCTVLERINGCESIVTVNNYAFYDDELMDFDAFPQNIKSVGECAFYLCQNLSIGSLPQSITSLGKSSFAYCTGLTELTIPKGITVIPYEAFRGCGAKTVSIPEGVVTIEDYALRAIKATEITLPNSLKKIGSNGIYSPLLRKIYMGKNLEEIADDAIYPSRSVVLYVYKDSLAMEYAIDKSINYEIINLGK
ncbi:MAG: leucine-rich repeat domain-containing protein [Eubacterium sp.]|nr:leucine-rich repeat domain-containing protein [Eubacterium sp.]